MEVDSVAIVVGRFSIASKAHEYFTIFDHRAFFQLTKVLLTWLYDLSQKISVFIDKSFSYLSHNPRCKFRS